MPLSSESSIVRRLVMQNHKSTYERLKKECKHQIMCGSGERHEVVATLKKSIIADGKYTPISLALDFELSIMLRYDVVAKKNQTVVFTAPVVIYSPSQEQCCVWVKSTAARKAIIKEVLRDL